MDIGNFAVLLTALGLGAILRDLMNRVLDRRKGKLEAEQSAWEQRDKAMRERDDEARLRRRLEEALHETRRCLNERGVPYDQMPAWPSRSK